MDIPNGTRKSRPRGDESARGSALSDLDLSSAARTDACVLLTGQEDAVRSLAYQIHSLSGWRHGPFTIVDCAKRSETLESELFGLLSETESAAGPEPYPRLAQAGTVLLHDVGRLPPGVQARIADRLVTLSEKRRAGSSRRLMASTSEPLLPRVLDGTFDDRLFYRLNVIHFVLPGERSTDDTRAVGADSETVNVRTQGRHGVSEHRAVAL